MRVISRWRVAALGSGVLLLLGACAQPQSPSAPAQDGWPAGRTFLSTSVTENDEPKPLVDGTRIRVSFGADGRVSANAGCNYLSGSGRLESGRLLIDGLAMTEMACPGGLMEQEAWVAEFLTSRPALRLDGDELMLTGEAITVTLLDREVADPDRPLAGTRWSVHTVVTGETASSTLHPVPAVLTIDAATSTFEATTGCVGGRLQGSATIAGDQITFAVTAEEGCFGAANPVSDAVRATLTGLVTYEIEADQLRLRRANGDELGLGALTGDEPTDCGVVSLDQLETPAAATLTCLLDAAAAGRAAHLTIVRPTEEGDPIITTYRTDGDASILVITDATQDRFGRGPVAYQVCEEPSVGEDGFLAFARCT